VLHELLALGVTEDQVLREERRAGGKEGEEREVHSVKKEAKVDLGTGAVTRSGLPLMYRLFLPSGSLRALLSIHVVL